jgi:hypothetical protein
MARFASLAGAQRWRASSRIGSDRTIVNPPPGPAPRILPGMLAGNIRPDTNTFVSTTARITSS